METLKTISIGDPHGNNIWKEINHEEYDKIIFMGDYVDSFVYPDVHILNNLEDIIEFKINYYDKVILLLGNHDLQYLFSYKHFGCSGYRDSMYPDLHELFNETKTLFQAAYGINTLDNRYLWTHAGVHSGWYYQKFLPTFKGTIQEEYEIWDQINIEFVKRNSTLFHIGHLRGGYYDVGGPFWADKKTTSKKPMKYLHQIVGHTRTDGVKQIDKDLYTSITYIDCLEYGDDFYKLNIYETE